MHDDTHRLARQVAALAHGRSTIGIAESLTAGRLSSALGAAPDASDWYAGAVVAYLPETKFDVLGVTPGPVNTAACARQMAEGALRILAVDLAASVTGVGGPGPDEGVPAGTVFVGIASRRAATVVEELHLAGSPSAVVEGAVCAVLRALAGALAHR